MATYSIFGLPGSPVVPLLHDIDTALRIRFINLGHEDLNGHAAQTYGEVHPNGVPGTVLCTHGPGLASCINAIAGARKESHGLVVVSVYEKGSAHRDFQYWETVPILSSIIGRDAVYDTAKCHGDGDAVAALIRTAYIDAQTARRPVAVLFGAKDLHTDTNYITVLQEVVAGIKKKGPGKARIVVGKADTIVPVTTNRLSTVVVNTQPQPIEGKTLQTQTALEPAPQTPIVVTLGEGATVNEDRYYNSSQEGSTASVVIIDKHTVPQAKQIKQFLEEHPGLHYATTFGGRVNFGMAHNVFLGVIGSGHGANKCITEAETVIFLYYDADSEQEGPEFFHEKYGVPSMQGKRVVKVTTGVMNKYGPLRLLQQDHISTKIKYAGEQKKNGDQGYWETEVGEAYDMYCDHRQGEVNHVVLGIGDFGYALGEVIVPRYPSHFFSSTKWGSIGIGVPNAMGVCAALADTVDEGTKQTVFVYEGDGSSLWASPALLLLPSTMQTHVPKDTMVIVTIFCNKTYGAVKEGMENDASSFLTQDTTYETVRVATVPVVTGKGVATYMCKTAAEYMDIIHFLSVGTNYVNTNLHVIYCYLQI